MQTGTEGKLKADLSPAKAWAFAVGTSVGWGSLVVTANTYLAQAGPIGSVLGLLLGMMVMLVISVNYAYMMNCYPEKGGAYAFCREALGYDHGFLTAWFMILTYAAMLWANATSLPLFARYFLGSGFRFGRMYTLFGYDVYFGETLLSACAVLIASLFCLRFRRLSTSLMLGMAVFFTFGIIVCAVSSFRGYAVSEVPAFVPEGNALLQILRIAVISPWAFIGYESISNSTEEFRFRQNLILPVLVTAVVTTALLYILVVLMSVSFVPEHYGSWIGYLADLNNLQGISALPAFHAAQQALGGLGLSVMMGSLLCLIFTSLIGTITALSRLFCALGNDRVLPGFCGRINRYGTPGRAILVIMTLSMLMPFVGRTAIGWIVDVTTFGATLIYALVSASAMKTAAFRNDRRERICGFAGLVLMILFGSIFLAPNLFAAGSIETESLFLFVVWSVLGFFVFRFVLKKDKDKHFGKSIIVWIALLSLILFVSLVWMNQSVMNAVVSGMQNVQAYLGTGENTSAQGFISEQILHVRHVGTRSIIVVVLVFALSLWVLLNNYSLLSRQAQHSERQLGLIMDRANRDPLTGVKSRLAYTETETELNRMITEGTAGKFGIAVCDVNGLKAINDTLGHKAGDEYLKKACHLICEKFANSPVYRIGGDEFAVILSGDDLERRQEILKELHDISVGNIGTVNSVVSAGTAVFEAGRHQQLQDVFDQADQLMYEEKKLLKGLGAAVRI